MRNKSDQRIKGARMKTRHFFTDVLIFHDEREELNEDFFNTNLQARVTKLVTIKIQMAINSHGPFESKKKLLY